MRLRTIVILSLGTLTALIVAVALGAGLMSPDLLSRASPDIEGGVDDRPLPVHSPRAEADAQFLAGHLDRAYEGYLGVIADDPSDIDARLQLTFVSLLRGNSAEAKMYGDEVSRLRSGGPEDAAIRAALVIAEKGAEADPAMVSADGAGA